jgi:hypothetical protein
MLARFARQLSIGVALTLSAPAIVSAQTPSAIAPVVDTSSTYWGCYVPNTGIVYRVKTANAPQTCTKSTHSLFSWDSPRTLETENYVSSIVSVPAGTEGKVIATCPAGMRVTGGGHMFDYINPAASTPFIAAAFAEPATNRYFLVMNNEKQGSELVKLWVYATCARLVR